MLDEWFVAASAVDRAEQPEQAGKWERVGVAVSASGSGAAPEAIYGAPAESFGIGIVLHAESHCQHAWRTWCAVALAPALNSPAKSTSEPPKPGTTLRYPPPTWPVRIFRSVDVAKA